MSRNKENKLIRFIERIRATERIIESMSTIEAHKVFYSLEKIIKSNNRLNNKIENLMERSQRYN